jgi:hypothetical protein
MPGGAGSAPDIAALHPVNGLLILLAAILQARESWRLAGLSEE